MKNLLLSLVVAMLGPSLLFSDAGVLIPRDKQQPNPAILSLEEMEITIRIDNGDARVFVRQVFANHTGRIEEGNYIFALPSHATISDFATWDGPVRLPAGGYVADVGGAGVRGRGRGLRGWYSVRVLRGVQVAV